MRKIRAVLDTSAFIYLQDFSIFEEIYTVPEVFEEVKDRGSKLKLSGLNVVVLEPSEESVKEVEKVAAQTGDIEKMSRTDIKILSLAVEKNLPIISDDRCVQNVARKLGLQFLSMFNPSIRKLIAWEYFCPFCGKVFSKGKEKCDVCGGSLKRRPKKN